MEIAQVIKNLITTMMTNIKLLAYVEDDFLVQYSTLNTFDQELSFEFVLTLVKAIQSQKTNKDVKSWLANILNLLTKSYKTIPPIFLTVLEALENKKLQINQVTDLAFSLLCEKIYLDKSPKDLALAPVLTEILKTGSNYVAFKAILALEEIELEDQLLWVYAIKENKHVIENCTYEIVSKIRQLKNEEKAQILPIVLDILANNNNSELYHEVLYILEDIHRYKEITDPRATAILLNILDNIGKNYKLSREIIYRLACINNNPKALPKLIKFIKIKEESVCYYTLLALSKITKSYPVNHPKLMPSLMKAFKDKELQNLVIEILGNLAEKPGKLDNKKITKTLITVLENLEKTNDSEDKIRYTCEKAAETLVKLANKEICLLLIKNLASSNKNLTTTIAYSIIKLQNHDLLILLIKKLIKKIESKNTNLRYWAIEILSIIANPFINTEDEIGNLWSFQNEYFKFSDYPTSKILYFVQTKQLTIISALLKRLNDPKLKVKVAAIRALKRFNVYQAVTALIKCLQDKTPSVRSNAINSLERLKDIRAIKPLLNCLEDKNKKVRYASLYALSKIVTLDSKNRWKYISHLANYLENTDTTICWNISKIITNILKETSLADMLEQLESKNVNVRYSILLRFIDLQEPKTIPHLIRVLKDKKAKIRATAALALGKLRESSATTCLIENVIDKNTKVRINSVIALGHIASQQAIPTLINALADKQTEVRFLAARSLKQIELPNLSSEDLNSLIKSLTDTKANVRAKVAEVLANTNDEKAALALLETLKDNFAWVRAVSAESIGILASSTSFTTDTKKKVLSALIQASEDSENIVREKVLFALGKMNSTQALPILRKALTSNKHTLRVAAIAALGDLRYRQTIPNLQKALEDQNIDVQIAAIKALGKIATPKVKETLSSLLKDEMKNFYLRQLSKKILEELKEN